MIEAKIQTEAHVLTKSNHITQHYRFYPTLCPGDTLKAAVIVTQSGQRLSSSCITQQLFGATQQIQF